MKKIYALMMFAAAPFAGAESQAQEFFRQTTRRDLQLKEDPECVDLDMAILGDFSGSQTEWWDEQKGALGEVIDHLNLGQDKVRCAFAAFANYAVIGTTLNDPAAYSAQQLKIAMNNIEFAGGGTRMRTGLEKIQQVLRSKRTGVKTLVALTSDFKDSDPQSAIDAAKAIITENGDVIFMCFVIGDNVNKVLAEQLCDTKNISYYPTFDALKIDAIKIGGKICKAGATNAPTKQSTYAPTTGKPTTGKPTTGKPTVTDKPTTGKPTATDKPTNKAATWAPTGYGTYKKTAEPTISPTSNLTEGEKGPDFPWWLLLLLLVPFPFYQERPSKYNGELIAKLKEATSDAPPEIKRAVLDMEKGMKEPKKMVKGPDGKWNTNNKLNIDYKAHELEDIGRMGIKVERYVPPVYEEEEESISTPPYTPKAKEKEAKIPKEWRVSPLILGVLPWLAGQLAAATNISTWLHDHPEKYSLLIPCCKLCLRERGVDEEELNTLLEQMRRNNVPIEAEMKKGKVSKPSSIKAKKGSDASSGANSV